MGFLRSGDVEQPATDIDDNIDGLTGLPDRWQLENWMSQHIARSRKTGDRFGVFLASVANLAEINSGYGSAVGDEVLQVVAEALSSSIGSRGQIARYLGSEFAIVWPGLFGANDARDVADLILESLPQQVTFEHFVVPVSSAIASVLSDAELNERLLLVEAEAALAEARSPIGPNVVLRDHGYGVRRRPDVLAVRLQRAFEADEFQLHYQPIVSLAAGTVVGFEAMLRWLSADALPTGAELLSPGSFLDALRASPVVVPLHAWVLRECLSTVKGWSERLRAPSLFGATNLDPSFIRDERFVDVVLQTVEDLDMRTTQVLLDLNGGSAGPQIGTLWPRLQQLKAAGVGIALEDFGVGHGSPDLLRRCRFDVIRLPRALVGGLGLADEDRIIIGGLIRLVHDLGCYVIAEGVETEEQAEILREIGCDLAQGYLYGRPRSEAETERDLHEIVQQARRVLPSAK